MAFGDAHHTESSMSAPTQSSMLGSVSAALFDAANASPVGTGQPRLRTLSASVSRQLSSSRSSSRAPSTRGSPSNANSSSSTTPSNSARQSSSSTAVASQKRLSPAVRGDSSSPGGNSRAHSPAASSKSRSDSGHGHGPTAGRSSPPSRALAPSSAPFPRTDDQQQQTHVTTARRAVDPAHRARSSPDLKSVPVKSKQNQHALLQRTRLTNSTLCYRIITDNVQATTGHTFPRKITRVLITSAPVLVRSS